jgi:hypothetical protein
MPLPSTCRSSKIPISGSPSVILSVSGARERDEPQVKQQLTMKATEQPPQVGGVSSALNRIERSE